MMQIKNKKTIVIHSKVAYGYVGSNTTSLVLQIAGQDVISVPTVILSNRYGLPTVGGGLMPLDLFQDVLDGILKLNIRDEVSSIVTGYIGSAELVACTAQFIQEIKKNNPDILYVCDPVMGDRPQGLYVNAEVPQAIMEYLLPLADVVTPNQFEIEWIINRKATAYDELVSGIQEHPILKFKEVIVTGYRFGDTSHSHLHVIVKQNNRFEQVTIDYVAVNPPGTGELFAALVLMLKLNVYHSYATCAKEAGEQMTKILQGILDEKRSEFELRDILKACQKYRWIE